MTELELVLQSVDEIRGEGFELSAAEEQELAEREAECGNGDKVDLRELLAALRTVGASHSNA